MSGVRRGQVPADNYTIVSNSDVRDAKLSFRARGILCWLLSHKIGFQVTEQSIVDAGPEGRDAVRSALRELEAAGYLRRDQRRRADGRFGSCGFALGSPPPVTAPVDWDPAIGADLPEHGVSAGHTVDWDPAIGALYLEEQKEKTKNYAADAARPTLNVITGDGVKKPEPTYVQAPLWPAAVPEPVESSRDVAIPEKAPTVTGPSAQTLIAEWIDHCTVRPPRRVVGQVAKLVAEMINDDGLPYEAVRRGLAAWTVRGRHPSTLPSIVNELANRRLDLAAAEQAVARPATAGIRAAQAIEAGRIAQERWEARQRNTLGRYSFAVEEAM